MIDVAPRVLIVDDHLMMREMVRKALRDYCKITRTETADNGVNAIALLEQAYAAGQPFDIVFLDWNMPYVSGLEVLTYFQNKPRFDRTAFVMLTVESEEQEIAQAIRAGARSYICKPVSGADLATKVNDLLQWLRRQSGSS
jgi:CheY-like chemotaxis protein